MSKKLVENNTNLSIDETSENDNILNKNRKVVRKIGRTILVKVLNDISTFDIKILDELEGLINKTDFNNNKTLFLTFDTNDNSFNALKKLRINSYGKYLVRFSYYKLFFTIIGLTDKSDYNTVKKGLIEFINKNSNIQVLYCKFYCKDHKYLGCGDLTVDTLEGMNKLLSKTDGFKEFTFDNLSGIFYKFNNKKKEN
jgi:hypothetical protein